MNGVKSMTNNNYFMKQHEVNKPRDHSLDVFTIIVSSTINLHAMKCLKANAVNLELIGNVKSY